MGENPILRLRTLIIDEDKKLYGSYEEYMDQVILETGSRIYDPIYHECLEFQILTPR